MAGYIFTFSTPESLISCVERGAYSTLFRSEPTRHWIGPHEGTFADYLSMKEGDNVYFFSKRQIYGIGRLVNVGTDCKYLNFPGANEPKSFDYENIRTDLLCDFGSDSNRNRFVCFFEPEPHIFRTGVDMDDVLSSDPNRFKMLRVFSQLSFIKFDDEENQAFRDILLKRNSQALSSPDSASVFESKHTTTHSDALKKALGGRHRLDVTPFLTATARQDGSISHEMAIEAGVISEISGGSTEVFGHWDYVSHQVAASPLKPVQYIDKMDLFGYSFIPNHRPTIERYFVGEIKAGIVLPQDLLQLMKYVDWVRGEYASGDYSMIRGFLIGHTFQDDLLDQFAELADRQYVSGSRERVENRTWNDVVLVKYQFDASTQNLVFSQVSR